MVTIYKIINVRHEPVELVVPSYEIGLSDGDGGTISEYTHFLTIDEAWDALIRNQEYIKNILETNLKDATQEFLDCSKRVIGQYDLQHRTLKAFLEHQKGRL